VIVWALPDLRGVVIAFCDLGPAFATFVGQYRFVVRTVLPLDRDHVAVAAGVPCGDLRLVEFVPPRPVEHLRILDVTPCDQRILPALVVARILFLQFRNVPVVGGVALFQRNHPAVVLDRATIQSDFARIVMDGRVIRFDLVDASFCANALAPVTDNSAAASIKVVFMKGSPECKGGARLHRSSQ
jgi:hypothetical protein